MKKLLSFLWVLGVGTAFAQSQPSSDSTAQTLSNKTISGASNTLSNIAPGSLASQAAGTVIGNSTAGSATPLAINFDAIKSAAEFGFVSGGNNNAAWAAVNTYLTSTITSGQPIEIDFPPGNFCSDTINISNPNNGLTSGGLIIAGAGMNSTQLCPNTTSNPIFMKVGSGGISQGLVIHDLSLQGIGATNPGQHGLYINGSPNTGGTSGGVWFNNIYNVKVTNFDGIQWIEKGDDNGFLIPDQFNVRSNIFLTRYAGNHNPVLQEIGQVGQYTWNQMQADGTTQSNNLGPDLRIGIDPHVNVTIASVTAAAPGVITLATNQGLVANGTQWQVLCASGQYPSVLSSGTNYWAFASIQAGVTSLASPAAETIELATSAANAGSGTGISFASGSDNTLMAACTLSPAAEMPTAVNTTTNIITTNGAHLWTTTDQVRVYGSALPSGLATATTYYVVNETDGSIALATSAANAIAGTLISLGSTGTIGLWGMGAVGNNVPYTQVFNALTTEASDSGVEVDLADDIDFLGLHQENMNYGLLAMEQAKVTTVGGIQATVTNGFYAASLSRISIDNLTIQGTYTNIFLCNGAGGFTIVGRPSVGSSTTGSGITAPWNDCLAQGAVTPASSISVTANGVLQVKTGATAISYLNSQLFPGDTVNMNLVASSGETVTFNNSGNLYLGGLTTEVFEAGTTLQFKLQDLSPGASLTAGTSWVLTYSSLPPVGTTGLVPTISGCGTAGAINWNAVTGAGSFTVGTGAGTCTLTLTLPSSHAALTGINIVSMTDRTAQINCLQTVTVSTTAPAALCNSTVTTGDLITFTLAQY